MTIIFYLFYFLSGISGLIYEIIWQRKLSLVLGTDIYAIIAILAVYFGGIGIGSLLSGRLLKRIVSHKKLILVYSSIEFCLGVYGVASIFIFPLIIRFEELIGFKNLFISNVTAFLFSLIGLIFPAILLGSTFPVVAKIVEGIRTFKSSASFLYGLNTLGAVIGASLSGFLLIWLIGVNQTLLIAAVINLGIGLATFLVYKNYHYKEASIKKEKSVSSRSVDKFDNKRSLYVYFTFFITGFLSLALEIIFTRVVVLIVGGYTYTFTIILIGLLISILIGSIIGIFIIHRVDKLLSTYFRLLVLTGLGLVLTGLSFKYLPQIFLSTYLSSNNQFDVIVSSMFLIISLIILIPGMFMGASFVTGLTAVTEKEKESLFKIYGINTLGGVLGILIASFLIIPTFGLMNSFVIVALMYLVIGYIGLFNQGVTKKIIFIFIVSSLLTFLGVKYIYVSPDVLTSGIYKNPDIYLDTTNTSIEETAKKEKLLFYKDGLTSNVSVKKDESGNINLRIDGKPDASTGDDMDTQFLLGHLPFLFVDNPKNALVVGLGSGITSGAILSHDIDTTTVEIEPEIINTLKYFKNENEDILNNPKSKIILTDGRNYLIRANSKYDIISSEPSNPWLTGSSKLFTKEYFQLMKNKLSFNGVAAQWLNLYAIDQKGIKRILKAFNDVFPETYGFVLPSSNDMIIVGSSQKIILSKNIDEGFSGPKVKNNLEKIKIFGSSDLISYFTLDKQSLEKIIGKEQPNTDNYPYVEFFAPTALYQTTSINPLRVMNDNKTDLDKLYKGVDGGDLQKFRNLRLSFYTNLVEGKRDDAYRDGEKLNNIPTNDKVFNISLSKVYIEVGSLLYESGKRDDGIKNISKALDFYKSSDGYAALGVAYGNNGKSDEATDAFEKALKIDDKQTTALSELAKTSYNIGDLNRAQELYRLLVKVDERNEDAYIHLANLYLSINDKNKAKEMVDKVLRIDPNNQEAKNLLQKINQ